MNTVPLVLYVFAALAYVWHFSSRSPSVGRAATTLLVAAACAHVFVIGMQTMAYHHVPIAGASPAISTFVCLLAIAYLCIETATDERAMGTFVLPLLVALQAVPAINPGIEDQAQVLNSAWFGVHVSSLLFAYASFALACVIGVTYVLQFKEIKAKHLGFFYTRLPSLQVLDRMNQIAIVFGWVFLTIGLIVGFIWAQQARAYALNDPRVRAMSLEDPEDLRGAGELDGVFIRVVRRPPDRLGRPPDGVSVGARVRHRAAELRADQLFPDDKSQLLGVPGVGDGRMHLLLIGISYKTAPVELRERLDFQSAGLERALSALAGGGITREAAVLSTCNRAELYAACDDVAVTKEQVLKFIADFHRVDHAEIRPHVYELSDSDAARHLFRVAAGLDSLVVGEPQILGQVKEAHTVATRQRSSGPVLNRLFHTSFAVGKRVRSETGLGSGAVSVGYAAVALARKIFGDLKGRSVLVIGAGEMGKLTALHMKSQGVHHVTIMSRTMGHAARVAEAIGGAAAAPWEERDAALGASDIVITATGAASPILTKAHLETIMRPRRNRPLFLIDIALPRDVESAAGEIEQVFLYNIDDLQATVRENMARRVSEVEHAEAIVGEELKKYEAWFRSRGAIPTVVALRQQFEAIRRSELTRLETKLSTLSPEQRARVDEVTHLIIEKLLLMPTEQLKAVGDPESVVVYSEALTRLFGLGERSDEEDDATPGGKVAPFPRAKSRR